LRLRICVAFAHLRSRICVAFPFAHLRLRICIAYLRCVCAFVFAFAHLRCVCAFGFAFAHLRSLLHSTFASFMVYIAEDLWFYIFLLLQSKPTIFHGQFIFLSPGSRIQPTQSNILLVFLARRLQTSETLPYEAGEAHVQPAVRASSLHQNLAVL
jgi:hypothetical protein